MMWMRTGLSEGVCETPRAGNGIHGGSGWVKWPAISGGLPVLRDCLRTPLVTGQPWRGQQRRTRMVVYRRIGKNNNDPMSPVAMLNQSATAWCPHWVEPVSAVPG